VEGTSRNAIGRSERLALSTATTIDPLHQVLVWFGKLCTCGFQTRVAYPIYGCPWGWVELSTAR
jgi:hypothetical protein